MWNCKSFYQVVSFIQLSEAGVLFLSLKMNKIENRAVIKFFVKEGSSRKEIHSKFINVYGNSSHSFSTIKKWAAEFKRGRTALKTIHVKDDQKCNPTRHLLTRLDEKIREKRPSLKKKLLSSGQCTRPQKCFGNGKIKGSALRIVGTSTLFPRFGSLWLLSLPKIQSLPRWSAFFFESRGDCSCRGAFCRSYEEPLQGWDNGAGASLE